MAYTANSGISIAEWAEVKKLVAELDKAVNQRLDTIGADTISTIRENISVLQLAITAINTDQAVQDRRLDSLENTAANKPLTRGEVQQMWGA